MADRFQCEECFASLDRGYCKEYKTDRHVVPLEDSVPSGERTGSAIPSPDFSRQVDSAYPGENSQADEAAENPLTINRAENPLPASEQSNSFEDSENR